MTQDEKIKSEIQNLLRKLNMIAIGVDLNDYGLPIYDEDANQEMSEYVYKWLVNIIRNADKGKLA